MPGGGFDADLVGDFEARLLAVERRSMALGDDLRTLRRGIDAARQGVWDSWFGSGSPVAIPAPTPVVCLVNSFPAICANIPCDLTLNDSYYGDCTISWDGSNAWTGCKSVTLPSNASCPGPVTFGIHYTLTGSNSSNVWNLTVTYKTANLTTHCPAASTCADTTNQTLNLTITLTSCHGTFIKSFSTGGGTPGTQAWPAFMTITLGVIFP